MARWFDKQLTEAKEHLENAKASLESAKGILEGLKDEQEEKMDNMSENLQGGSRIETMSNRFDEFGKACDSVDEVDIDDIIEKLDGIE